MPRSMLNLFDLRSMCFAGLLVLVSLHVLHIASSTEALVLGLRRGWPTRSAWAANETFGIRVRGASSGLKLFEIAAHAIAEASDGRLAQK